MHLPDQEKPPLFRRWKGWYWLLFAVLFGEAILFYFFTKHFS